MTHNVICLCYALLPDSSKLFLMTLWCILNSIGSGCFLFCCPCPPALIFFCVLAFFLLLLIGSKLLSNSSVLCSVRGFASWMLDQPFTSHSLWFCPLPRRISCSQFLAVLVGFKLPFSGPRVRLHSSHTSLDPALFPHSSHSQGIFFPSSGCG